MFGLNDDGPVLPSLGIDPPPPPPRLLSQKPEIPNKLKEFIGLCKTCDVELFPRDKFFRNIGVEGPNHYDGFFIGDIYPESLSKLLSILTENYENMVRDENQNISKIDLIEIFEYLESQLKNQI